MDARSLDATASRRGTYASRAVTVALIVSPFVAIALVLLLRAGPAVSSLDVGMAVGLYVITGFGIAVGFHRLLTHSSFVAHRGVRLVLVAAGSMAVEGSVIGWVANHRRHHMFSDVDGDPHSPWRYDGRPLGRVRGFLWSHLGWLFTHDTTDAARFAPDLLRDRDMVLLSRLFPVLAIASILMPGLVGWGVTGTFAGALTGVVWAGLVRVALFHHVTWSINSLCHMLGTRPFDAPDRSANVAPLALLSFGESWHNFHHACPSSARHGVLPHQVDAAAGLIRLLERSGLATKVRWPSGDRVALARRHSTAGASPLRVIDAVAPSAGRHTLTCASAGYQAVVNEFPTRSSRPGRTRTSAGGRWPSRVDTPVRQPGHRRPPGR